MYMKKMISVGQASNGYVVECQVPIKKAEEKGAKAMMEAYPGSCDKQYIAESAEDVAEIISKLMPMLDSEFSSEDEFDMAFNKAAGVDD